MEEVIQHLLENEEKFEIISQSLFKDADTGNKHVIKPKDFNKVINEISDDLNLEMPSEEEIKKILDKIDLNKDGKIEYDEFKTFLRNLFKEMLDEC